MKYYFVPGLFLLGTLFFGYLYIVGPDPYATNPGVLSPKTSGNTISYNKLEQYKKEAQVKLDIQKQRAENRGKTSFGSKLSKKNKIS